VDSPKSVEKRLEEYHTYTARSVEFFRKQGTLIDVDGALSPEQVQHKIFTFLME
jgi:adenylate kinase family enzyme